MTEPRLADVLRDVETLYGEVQREGQKIGDRWRDWIERENFAASAPNFAHYLAFRRRDIRPLQRRMMQFGLSKSPRRRSDRYGWTRAQRLREVVPGADCEMQIVIEPLMHRVYHLSRRLPARGRCCLGENLPKLSELGGNACRRRTRSSAVRRLYDRGSKNQHR